MSYNDTNEEFEYTDRFVPDSSFVEEVCYDADTQELLVFLNSGSGYLYHNVPVGVFESFRVGEPGTWLAPRSVGRFYNLRVKRAYGPATEVAWATEPVEKSASVPSMADVAQAEPVDLGSLTVLTAPEVTEASDVRTYVVRFTVEGGNSIKEYSVEATGFDAAEAALQQVADLLDLIFDVKGIDRV